jgi:Ras family protein T1
LLSPEQKPKLIAECQAADAVVLTYACDRPSTLERLSSFWLPELRRLQVIVRLAHYRGGFVV